MGFPSSASFIKNCSFSLCLHKQIKSLGTSCYDDHVILNLLLSCLRIELDIYTLSTHAHYHLFTAVNNNCYVNEQNSGKTILWCVFFFSFLLTAWCVHSILRLLCPVKCLDNIVKIVNMYTFVHDVFHIHITSLFHLFLNCASFPTLQ